MKGVLLVLAILCLVHADDFYYRRVLDCVQNNTLKCTKWNETTRLSYYTFYAAWCFSEDTHVLTTEGAKPIRAIKVGDQIWSIDFQTGKKKFSEVVAWLHRDRDALAQYEIIDTDAGVSFQTSEYHNIGYINDNGKIDFKFAVEVSEGDRLVGFPTENISVLSSKTREERRGLFAPFTEAGNYFVYHAKYAGNIEEPMILAHSLSQVRNPSSQLGIAQTFISAAGLMGKNIEPEYSVRYTHPLISTWKFIFGSNWEGHEQRVKYPIDMHDQSLPSSYKSPTYSSGTTYSSSSYSPSYSSYSSPSYSGYSSYSSPSLFGGYSSYNSYNSYPYRRSSYSSSSSTCVDSYSNNCQQERQDKMQALGLSISIVQQIPLF